MGLIRLAPVPHGVQNGFQAVPQVGQRVFHAGRDLRVDLSLHKPAFLHRAELREDIARGYDLILTSHYTPEDLKDAQTKIDYLESLKRLAAGCTGAEAFKAEMRKRYPSYSGQNYLDMTAGFFYA